MSRPSGPHNHVQKAKDASSATWDLPPPPREDGFEHEIREQLEHDEQAHHPERTRPAREGGKTTRIGAPAPITGPMYGMNRRAAPSAAQTNGYGTPRA